MFDQFSKQLQAFGAARRCATLLFVLFWMNFHGVENLAYSQERFGITCNDKRSGLEIECRVRDCDQVFLVSSREMQGRDCPLESLRVWRACEREWIQTDMQHLLNSEFCEAKRKTVVFVHGHMTNFDYAQIRGFQAYQAIFTDAKNAPPTRFIIWAWPSESRGDKRYTSGLSFQKADVHAFFLSKLLFRFEQGTPVSFVGYSYGCRVVLGALHLGGGGRIDGHGIDMCSSCALSPYTVTLVAPGIRGDCLECNGERNHALKLIDQLLLVHNPRDPALKAFRIAPVTGCAKVMGMTGITHPNRVQDYHSKVRQVNVQREIGCRHAISNYIESKRIIGEIQNNLFFYGGAKGKHIAK